MTDPFVPTRPVSAHEAWIKSGSAVRSSTWSDLGNQANYLLGAGSILIPYQEIAFTTWTAVEHIFRYRAQTRAQGRQRLWTFTFDDVNSGEGPGLWSFKVPHGGTAQAFRAPGDTHTTLEIVETVGSPAYATTDITFAVTPPGAGVYTFGVACEELPRKYLANNASTDDGVNVAEMRVTAPIIDNVTKFVRDAAASTDTGRQGTLFAWAVPATVGGVTSTSFVVGNATTTFAPLFQLGIPGLARKLYRTSTTGTVRGCVYGWTTSGASPLEVRFTSSRSGTTSATATTTSTSPTWLTAIDFAIDCEDLATTDGLRGPSTFDLMQLEFRRTAGAGTVYVAGVCILNP